MSLEELNLPSMEVATYELATILRKAKRAEKKGKPVGQLLVDAIRPGLECLARITREYHQQGKELTDEERRIGVEFVQLAMKVMDVPEEGEEWKGA